MMNADMDGMFFVFLFVCSWFCGAYIALLSNRKIRESILRRLWSGPVYLFIIPSSSRKDLRQLPFFNYEMLAKHFTFTLVSSSAMWDITFYFTGLLYKSSKNEYKPFCRSFKCYTTQMVANINSKSEPFHYSSWCWKSGGTGGENTTY